MSWMAKDARATSALGFSIWIADMAAALVCHERRLRNRKTQRHEETEKGQNLMQKEETERKRERDTKRSLISALVSGLPTLLYNIVDRRLSLLRHC